ncbi:hypothetical protein LOTGIDRAFT_123862 [Lottia gigantea]|uniref:Xylulose kinase n=1 Tax=Lottia gigantea TaxID=225164 RepID=V3ZG33_LOTGI|nr:hypothetical protein LOTGIDRAFT_123862 [Lottia gigantea]ESO90173.1 hypothetical protein LOTGIDRAFT_123862 [Lottia gigantea]
MSNGNLYLGFDFSTQQIKVLAIDDQLKVQYEFAVKFDVDLPEYKTQGGAHISSDKSTVTTPTIMWVQAFDMVLDKMKNSDFPFSNVAGISGSGQQHGSVYWKRGAKETLQNLNPSMTLKEQLKNCFSIGDSPIWMDSSTRKQCDDLEKAVGGTQKLSDITGSIAFERFTGNQIAKIYQTKSTEYTNTERISLVSSFAASLLIGLYAPIDESDGSGMNLMNIKTRDWSEECLKACGKDLRERLGSIVPSRTVVGKISRYYVDRYGFNIDCLITAFTGDNPSSLAGIAPKQGDIILSLGTSDVLFLWITDPNPGLAGHIFVNPVDTKAYMALLCFKNSSLTRERICKEVADGSWSQFSNSLKSTPMGNNGNIGIYFDVMEIQPLAVGVYRYDDKGQQVPSFDKDVEIRAVLESQIMARRNYSEMLGFNISSGTRVIATGGASSNVEILQVISDIFNCNVYVKDVVNSASLGAAIRAKQGCMGNKSKFDDIVKNIEEPVCVAKPTPGSDKIYNDMCKRYKRLEEEIAKNFV